MATDPSSTLALLALVHLQADALEEELLAILHAAPSPALSPVGFAPAGAPVGEGPFEEGMVGQGGAPSSPRQVKAGACPRSAGVPDPSPRSGSIEPMSKHPRAKDAPENLPWRGIRIAAGMTLEALARRLDVCATTLRRFELGNRQLQDVTVNRLTLTYRDLERTTAARLAPSTPTT
jgi:hypothetical protein